MNSVPNIISTKDLSYIKDMMKWNMIIGKKANYYETIVSDEEIKKYFCSVGKKMKGHYEKLMNILGE